MPEEQRPLYIFFTKVIAADTSECRMCNHTSSIM